MSSYNGSCRICRKSLATDCEERDDTNSEFGLRVKGEALRAVPERLATILLVVSAMVPAKLSSGLGEKAWSPAGTCGCVGAAVAALPTTRLPPFARLMGVPGIVAAGPPALRVVSAIVKCEGSLSSEPAVKIWPAIVNEGACVSVFAPMTRLTEDAKLMWRPDIVAAGPFMDRVVEATTTADGFRMVRRWPAAVTI